MLPVRNENTLGIFPLSLAETHRTLGEPARVGAPPGLVPEAS